MLGPLWTKCAWSGSPEDVDERSRLVTGNRAIAPIAVGLQAAVLSDELLPRPQQLGGVPLTIRQSRPAAPDSIRSQPKMGEPRDDSPTALEEATTE